MANQRQHPRDMPMHVEIRDGGEPG
ncbi:MAG: hypothetical protein QOG89_3009, partial [Thermomicrobiales bacterium]|nr:hypothetical protein [Thermomicrobiales bacterium]